MPCTAIYHVMLQAVLLRLKREMASYEQAGRVWLGTRVSGRAHPKPKPIPKPSPSPSASPNPNPNQGAPRVGGVLGCGGRLPSQGARRADALAAGKRVSQFKYLTILALSLPLILTLPPHGRRQSFGSSPMAAASLTFIGTSCSSMAACRRHLVITPCSSRAPADHAAVHMHMPMHNAHAQCTCTMHMHNAHAHAHASMHAYMLCRPRRCYRRRGDYRVVGDARTDDGPRVLSL